MKFITVCTVSLFVLAYFCTPNDAESHNVSWGARSIGDGLLQREVIHRKSRFLGKARGDYTYEQKNVEGYPRIITFVNVTDQYTNNKGGYATLTSGGPSYPSVQLHFTSKFWRGYNFIVEIFGI